MQQRTERSAAPRRGFTLIEVLAVLMLIGIVMGVAVNFYIDLSRATRRAADSTRGVRRATAILDRVVRDLEATVLVTNPPGQDPLAHPWVFLGQSELGEGGSDHLKFVVRGHEPRSTESRESDLAMVAYSVRPQDDDATRLELRRWTSSQLPDHLDLAFPDDEDTQLVADGLAAFSVRFLDEQGNWQEDWNSSQIADSGALPVAVEVSLALAPDDASAAGSALTSEGELPRMSRLAVLPMRPIDLQALLEPEGMGGGDAAQDEAEEQGEGGGRGRDAEGEGSEHASADEEGGNGVLSAKDVKPECTLGSAVAQVPNSDAVPFVGASWEAFVEQNKELPLSQFAQLFRRENIRPECLN